MIYLILKGKILLKNYFFYFRLYFFGKVWIVIVKFLLVLINIINLKIIFYNEIIKKNMNIFFV